ncbi:MAG: Sec-independent protein translocase protein TatC [Alphaproteobacteria bacterium MarineAlpha5_Bin8]|nr:MAG: Sec-independent protein translocase protein TatC [Alphaproteobacteria bacterium MarineAlpha5_Bin8]PPR53452.1 MAG: Sec-independent protein translocase protein TatC [Alphaproteobacteria bacterium MarineAlpha5_Bin6]|tara:strand:- start:1914 stop:2681 length:768 start_codon:yes stop_codon:yes gene_type:complete
MNSKKSKLDEMSLIDHLTELRKRLLWSFLYIIIIFVICFYFASDLFAFLAKPLVDLMDTENGQGFIYTALQEAFFTELKIAFFFALFFSFPLISIQIWKFIAPGLYKNEKHAFLPFLIATPFLFFAGGSMVYFFIAPIAWNFFLSYQNINTSGIPIRLEAKMGEYLALMMRFIFAFGLAFQLPVVLSLLAKVNLVTHESLKKFRKYAIVIAFLSAAFLTPPDPFSQISLALPIILLYEISIFLAKIIQKNKNKKE